MGYNIFGSPYTPIFHNWAFMLSPEGLKAKWKEIPDNTDILITHGPPKDVLDKCITGINAGCEFLREEVLNRVKPKYHIFGHIHETYGIEKIDDTTFINASNVNLAYKTANLPIVFELPIKN
jgi:Icc-related predicted phosphoesterase